MFILWVKIFPSHQVAYRTNSLLLCECASDLTFQFTLLRSTDVFTLVTLNQLLFLSLGHTFLSSFIFAREECPLYLECPLNPYLGTFIHPVQHDLVPTQMPSSWKLLNKYGMNLNFIFFVNILHFPGCMSLLSHSLLYPLPLTPHMHWLWTLWGMSYVLFCVSWDLQALCHARHKVDPCDKIFAILWGWLLCFWNAISDWKWYASFVNPPNSQNLMLVLNVSCPFWNFSPSFII